MKASIYHIIKFLLSSHTKFIIKLLFNIFNYYQYLFLFNQIILLISIIDMLTYYLSISL